MDLSTTIRYPGAPYGPWKGSLGEAIRRFGSQMAKEVRVRGLPMIDSDHVDWEQVTSQQWQQCLDNLDITIITHIITWSAEDSLTSFTDPETGIWRVDDWAFPVSSWTATLETIDGDVIDVDGFDCVPDDHPAREELLDRFGDHDPEDEATYHGVEARILKKHGLDEANVSIDHG